MILWFPALGLIGIAGGIAFIWLRRFLWPWQLAFIPLVVTVGAIIWTIAATGLVVTRYVGLSTALKHGQCSYTEGLITSFSPAGKSGRGWETFKVNDVSFRYSDSVVTPGFTNEKPRIPPPRGVIR